MSNRLNKFRKLMQEKHIGTYLVVCPENRRYLSGFTGSSAYLLITPEKAWLLTDFRYIEQAKAEAPEFEIVRHSPKWEETLQQLLKGEGSKELAFEQDFITYNQYLRLSEHLSGLKLEPEQGIMSSLRMVKDEAELELLRQAVKIADEGFDRILNYITPGLTEVQVAVELEFCLRRLGAERAAFDFIVAAGEHSALPHATPGNRELKQGEQVKMDYGGVVQGYHSDITRTVFLGQASDRFREIYYTVLEAQEKALAAIAPGKNGREIDAIARDFIASRGFGEFFGHGLGHGVGLEIHEQPTLSTQGETILQPGMVVTVEPGIYLPDWGGVRIEDMVVVTASGCEILTKAPKALIEL
ncbi:MAG TPA: Xaa-Pro peptidase family protein [Bacillota bacterium]|nr:Xaa-Pro peptidase family protein [Bacillota bacterium]